MKKYLTVIILACSALCVSAQNHMFWYNPYTAFTPTTAYGVAELIFQDTSGQVWSTSYDQDNSILHIVNQDGTKDDSIAANISYESPAFDKRNWLWVITDYAWYLGRNGSMPTVFTPPHFVSNFWWYALDLDFDNAGNVYFLSKSRLASNDSSFLIRYNSSSFQSTYLDTLPVPFNNTSVVPRYTFCDTTGALYLECKAYGFMKYYQGLWTHPAFKVDTNSFLIAIDKNNNFYFQSDSGGPIIRMNSDALDTIPLPPDFYNQEVYGSSFNPGPDGNLWFFTDANGFYKFNAANGSWTNIAALGFVPQFYAQNYNSASGWPALFDRQGRMWTTGGANGYPYEIGVYSFTALDNISGRVFYDGNGNGVVDNNEHGFTPMNIVQSTNGYYVNTDTSGDYNVTYLDSSYYYTVTATPPQYYHLTTPATYNASPADSVCCYNFGVLADGNIQDLQITTASYCARPGLPAYTWLNYQNIGTTTVSDTITYVFDNRLSYVNAVPAPTSVSGNKLSWAYQNLQPFQSGVIGIEFLVSSNAAIGDTLSSTATIQPVAADTTPADNVSVNMQAINNSFDPNIKTVSTNYGASPGQQLTYTIYFQNTGTAPAINITLIDTLDVNINPATFRLLGSSSPVKASLSGTGVLSFSFTNINLPDSSISQLLSTGFVQFSVNISAPLNQAAGVVTNTGSIYFDSNAPVQTNTVNTTFTGVGIKAITVSNLVLTLIPNPATDQLFIKTENIQPQIISVYDVDGRMIFTQPFNPEININWLSSGVYFVEVNSKEGVVRKRFVKM